MSPKDLAELLVGKVIKEVHWHRYLEWPMCIEEIEFTDGTVVNVGGDADYGRFDAVTLPNGECEGIYEEV